MVSWNVKTAVALAIVVLLVVTTSLLLSGRNYVTPAMMQEWLKGVSATNHVEEEQAVVETKPRPLASVNRLAAVQIPSMPEELKRWGPLLKEILIDLPVGYPKCENVLKTVPAIEGSWEICQDEPFTLHAPCLVYSFGVAFDFSFEDALAKFNCDVVSFDPSMNVSDHQRSERIRFFATGLGAVDADDFSPRLDGYVKSKTTWKIRTLDSLRRELGHEHRTIDVLKIDIESSEWAVMKQMLDNGSLDNVKQLALEWHVFQDAPPRHFLVELISVVVNLRRNGFVEFTRSGHPYNGNWDSFNIQSDVSYINTRFIKK